MATRNFVPRTNNDGSIGLEDKKWQSGFINDIKANNLTVDNISKCNITSPSIKDASFTGTVTVPTVNEGTSNSVVASTLFVSNAIKTKADINNPVFTGYPIAPTMQKGDASDKIATTAFVACAVQEALNVLLPIGIVLPYAGKGMALPSGYLLCDGSSYSRTDYPELYAIIGTLYGSATSTTFKVPNLKYRFLEGDTTNNGEIKEAGLPNIVGSISQNNTKEGTTYGSGAIVVSQSSSGRSAGSGGGSYGFTFDASRCSSIYGNSTTVQPESLLMKYIIKAK